MAKLLNPRPRCMCEACAPLHLQNLYMFPVMNADRQVALESRPGFRRPKRKVRHYQPQGKRTFPILPLPHSLDSWFCRVFAYIVSNTLTAHRSAFRLSVLVKLLCYGQSSQIIFLPCV